MNRPEFFCLAAILSTLLVQPLSADTLSPTQTQQISQQHRAVDHELPRIQLKIGSQPLVAEVADPAHHARGLMFRESLAPDHGMLFLFPQPHQPCFWMKNTYVPLTVAFIDERGTIISLADMQPESLDTHCAPAPIRYALEMEQGWFARHGAKPGTQVLGLP